MSICPDCGGEHVIVGRPIDELHAILIDKIKTITGSWVDPVSGNIFLGRDGEHVATLVWPEATEALIELSEATRQ